MKPSVALARFTTLGLGGPAALFAEIEEGGDLVSGLEWARGKNSMPVFILGGGSNLVVSDEGFAGLVLHMRTRGRDFKENAGELRVEVAAGETWDDVVADVVSRDAAGIECLSGIPGSAGAAPVQNIGAYGQEVASVIRQVRVLDRISLRERQLDATACCFGYRDSIFKREPDRFVILSVTLGLAKAGRPSVRYPELMAVLGDNPSVADVRIAVRALRRKKAMLIEEADPEPRSAGSFFTNPIVTTAVADAIAARVDGDMPRYPLPDGRVKLAAGWLIERAGIAKGFRMGPVGVSSKHALALVHHGGGTTADLLRLARHVHAAVRDRFGVALVPEPVFLGLDRPT